MAFSASRRAASPLLLTAAAGAPSVGPSLLHNTPASSAARSATSPLLLTTIAGSTITPFAAGAPRSAITILRDAPSSAAVIPLLLTDAATVATTTGNMRSASTRFGGRSVTLPLAVTLPDAASAGSMLARRGIASGQVEQALSPEVKSLLKSIEAQWVAQHEAVLKDWAALDTEMKNAYSAAKISEADAAITAGKVAWRVTTAVLAFGVTTTVSVLQTLKEGWRVDFQAEVKKMIEDTLESIKTEVLSNLRKVVKTQIMLIEGEKAIGGGGGRK